MVRFRFRCGFENPKPQPNRFICRGAVSKPKPFQNRKTKPFGAVRFDSCFGFGSKCPPLVTARPEFVHIVFPQIYESTILPLSVGLNPQIELSLKVQKFGFWTNDIVSFVLGTF